MPPNNDNDILIQIETAYKSGDMDAFKRSLDDAKKKVDNLSNSQDQLKDKSNQANKELNNGQRALSGLNAAASVSRGSFQGLSQTMEIFGGKIAAAAAKFTVMAGSFSAGYAIGKQLDGWLNISQKIADLYAGPMQKVGSIQDRIRASVEGLAKADLSRLAEQFARVADAASEAEKYTNAMYGAKLRLMGERGELEIAQIERDMEPGPARDKAVLEARRKQSLEEIQTRRQQQRDKLATATQTYEAGKAQVSAAQEAVDAAQFGVVIANANTDRNASPEFRATRAAEARAQLAAAQATLTSAQDRFAPIEESFGQTRFEVGNEMRSLALQEETAKARYGAGMAPIVGAERASAANRSLVAGRLQSMISAEGETMLQSGVPSGVGMAAAESRAGLTQLLKAVQSGNEEITKELIGLFQDQATNQEQLRATIQTMRDKMKNMPL